MLYVCIYAKMYGRVHLRVHVYQNRLPMAIHRNMSSAEKMERMLNEIILVVSFSAATDCSSRMEIITLTTSTMTRSMMNMFMPRLSSRRSRVSFQYVSSNTTRFDSCTTEAEALSILVLATTTFLGTGALLPETQRIMPWRRASKDRSSLSAVKCVKHDLYKGLSLRSLFIYIDLFCRSLFIHTSLF